jgi:hypothetical protein
MTQQLLEPLEKQLVEVIKKHPEYQAILTQPEKYKDKEYLPELGEINPFFHLSLHQAVFEQVSVNLPKGIRKLYQELIIRLGDPHEAEHCMMSSLAIGLYDAKNNFLPFDNQAYVKRIKKALRNGYW